MTCATIPNPHNAKTYEHLPRYVQNWIYHTIKDAPITQEPTPTHIMPVDEERACIVWYTKRKSAPGEFAHDSNLGYMDVAEIVAIEFISVNIWRI